LLQNQNNLLINFVKNTNRVNQFNLRYYKQYHTTLTHEKKISFNTSIKIVITLFKNYTKDNQVIYNIS